MFIEPSWNVYQNFPLHSPLNNSPHIKIAPTLSLWNSAVLSYILFVLIRFPDPTSIFSWKACYEESLSLLLIYIYSLIFHLYRFNFQNTHHLCVLGPRTPLNTPDFGFCSSDMNCFIFSHSVSTCCHHSHQ